MLPASPILFREKTTADLRDSAEGGLPPASEALLQARIKDLKLHLAGTPLEKHIHQLYSELQGKGISLRPQCYLSDQWGCASRVRVFGSPPRLRAPMLDSLASELRAGAELGFDRIELGV